MTSQSASRLVLVVDDDHMTRTLIASVLEDGGYAVAHAATAADAVAMIEAGTSIGLVLTDVVMPGAMDGLALARWLRQAHPSIAVVLVSGLPVPGAEAAGIGYLPKPFAMHEVISAVQQRIGPPA